MKKFTSIIASISMLMYVMPALATDGATIQTEMVREDSTGGANPVVKVMWEMWDSGKDDSINAGAQFMPTGIYKQDKSYKVCAIVTDADGLDDINKVYADVFYPENIFLGPNHEDSRRGCGMQLGDEFTLTRLTKSNGIDLFCTRIQNNNTDLPSFNNGYDYSKICAFDGELWKETAAVYCGNAALSYEDPSGMYSVLVDAQDKWGADGQLENQFEYLPLTAFETDFTSVSYGNVKLNTHKIINGNMAFVPGDKLPTVRNIGNTVLEMTVRQDDMGLGKTNGLWNVKFDGRVGSDAEFVKYDPEATTEFEEHLLLSETDEMDFSIFITKFPPTHDGSSYTGTMILGAVQDEHLTCTSVQI